MQETQVESTKSETAAVTVNTPLVARAADRYLLGEEIARGGMGEVYRATDTVHDLGTLPDSRPFLAMKLIKGETLEKLLKQRPSVESERGRFLAVFGAICQSVGYAHAHGVIHRDLKPANIMVGAFGEVQVMDWGLAKVLASGGRQSANPAEGDPNATAPATEIKTIRNSDDVFTQAGSIMGTPNGPLP